MSLNLEVFLKQHKIVLCKYETIEFEKVEKGIVKTLGFNRGGGFGHTGTK